MDGASLNALALGIPDGANDKRDGSTTLVGLKLGMDEDSLGSVGLKLGIDDANPGLVGLTLGMVEGNCAN